MFVQVAAIVTILLGIAYVLVPRTMQRFNPDILRDTETEVPDVVVWMHRALGIGLIMIGLSHLP